MDYDLVKPKKSVAKVMIDIDYWGLIPVTGREYAETSPPSPHTLPRLVLRHKRNVDVPLIKLVTCSVSDSDENCRVLDSTA